MVDRGPHFRSQTRAEGGCKDEPAGDGLVAYLQPENLASRGDVPAPLQDVARVLRDELADDVVVSLETEPGDAEPYLAVLDPDRGVFLLAVVGAQRREILDALERANSVKEALTDDVSERIDDQQLRVRTLLAQLVGDRGIPISIAVAVPSWSRARAERYVGSEVATALLLEDDLTATTIGPALDRLVGGRLSHGLTSQEEDAIRGGLHPDIVIRDSSRVEESEEVDGRLVFSPPEGEDVIAVLDREQENLARHLGDGYRVIRGVAGSGKTLVLTFRARFLAEHFPNMRILLTCFNVVLARALAKELEDLESVTVAHIDSLAAKVCSAASINVPRSDDMFDQRRRRAAEALSRSLDLDHYDLVLVDEAQDFDEAGLALAYACLGKGRSDFVIALDAAQNIYRKRHRWNPPGVTARGRTKLLRRNYRNTREIVEFAYRFLCAGGEITETSADPDDLEVVIPPESTSRTGNPPVVRTSVDLKRGVRDIADLIVQRHNDGVAWGDMAVLYGTRSWQTELYSELRRRGVPYFWITQDAKSKRAASDAGDTVKASTFQGIKGLEFSRVFLCGVNDIYEPGDDDGTRRRFLYTGMTRAVDELFVLVSGTGALGDDLIRLG